MISLNTPNYIEGLLKQMSKRILKIMFLCSYVPIIDSCNYMADVIHMPSDKFGYNKLLVVVDIGSDAFYIEKMKGETAKETLNAYKRMLTRNIIKLNYLMLQF